ncbi:MAG: hypothetical protein ABEI11_03165 [Haloarculaceae archaeon]
MSLNRCSEALAVVLLLIAATAPAAAVASDVTGLPEESRVGTDVRAQFTLTELYADGSQEWTLRGNTSLTAVQWTVEKRTLSGNVTRESYSGGSFATRVAADEDVEEVVVTIAGTTPEVSNYSYEPRQTYLFAEFEKTVGGSNETITERSVHHYTNESREARLAIDSASEVVNETSSDEAKRLLNNSISAYDTGNFDNAIDLAEQAETEARTRQQSNRRTQLLLFGGIGVLALAAIGGGLYYYRSRQDDYDKLG